MELRAQAESRIEDSPSLAHHAGALYRKTWPQARRIPERSLAAFGERVASRTNTPAAWRRCWIPTLCQSRGRPR